MTSNLLNTNELCLTVFNALFKVLYTQSTVGKKMAAIHFTMHNASRT